MISDNRYHILYNPVSGGGKSRDVLTYVMEKFDEHDIPYEVLETHQDRGAGDIIRMLENGIEDDIRLIIIGGDGTIGECLDAMVETKRFRVGIIPSGSANDFVHGMGLPLKKEESLRRIISDREGSWIDIGYVSYDGATRRYGISSGIGFDALVCYRVDHSKLKKILNKIGLGGLVYGIVAATTLVTVKTCHATIHLDNRCVDVPRLVFASSQNTPYEGGSVMMAPLAKTNDGKQDICVGHSLSGIPALVGFVKILRKKHMKDRHFVVRPFSKCVIECDRAMCLHADGEHLGFYKRAEFGTIEKAMRIYGKEKN